MKSATSASISDANCQRQLPLQAIAILQVGSSLGQLLRASTQRFLIKEGPKRAGKGGLLLTTVVECRATKKGGSAMKCYIGCNTASLVAGLGKQALCYRR